MWHALHGMHEVAAGCRHGRGLQDLTTATLYGSLARRWLDATRVPPITAVGVHDGGWDHTKKIAPLLTGERDAAVLVLERRQHNPTIGPIEQPFQTPFKRGFPTNDATHP